MVDLTDPRTFWLNVTNMAMGVIVLAALLSLIGCIIREAVRRSAIRSGDCSAMLAALRQTENSLRLRG